MERIGIGIEIGIDIVIFYRNRNRHRNQSKNWYRPITTPDLGNFESAQTGRRKSRNQDFKAAPAWSISSGQMESGPGALPGFKC